jgi:UDP-N-acetyl-D-mannosaminuronic acid transferase (WecB/TagA/CpsF family)
MQRAGLEWAHRLVSEPRRLLVRYLTTNTAFLIRVAAVLSRRALSNGRASSRVSGEP